MRINKVKNSNGNDETTMQAEKIVFEGIWLKPIILVEFVNFIRDC